MLQRRRREWERIKAYLTENKYIGNEKAREITGIVQVTKMSRILSKWTKQGLLTRIEAKKGSKSRIRYKLANQEDITNTH
jgi:predicted HTH transcriptional regulator